jgi:hypothetical protein
MSSETDTDSPTEMPYKSMVIVLRSGREFRSEIDPAKLEEGEDLAEVMEELVEGLKDALSTSPNLGGNMHFKTEAGLTIVPLHEIESVTLSYS